MKKLIVFAALFSSFSLMAQMKEGRIVYERITQLPTRFLSNMDPNIAAQIPKTRKEQFELLFSNNQALWQVIPDATNDGDANTFASGGVVLRFAGGGTDVSYYDFNKGTSVSQREIAEKNYLVSDSIQKMDWKLSDETKTILTYTAKKATSQRITTRPQINMENGEMKRVMIPDTLTIVAWFTTDIPVPAGPGMYQGQLPGMILELDENNGQTVFKAIETSPKVSANKIKEPKDGKKMTAAEFAKERDRVMEEMRKNMPGGMQIRTMN